MRETDLSYIKSNLPIIGDSVAKYDRGHLLLIAGSYGMAGAVILAAKGALRTGVGYLSILMPESIYPMVTVSVPEAVCLPYIDGDTTSFKNQLNKVINRVDAVIMGPGPSDYRNFICPVVLEKTVKKLVLDADGLNYLSEQEEANLPVETVLTPHTGEAARLLQVKRSEVEENRLTSVSRLSEKYHCTALLKGKGTLIKNGEEVFINPTGNAGMARAGSGDVLSGIIGSLLSQGMNGFQAAVSGAFIHGLSGDLARNEKGIRSMLPSDLLEKIPEVMKMLEE